MKFGVLHIRFPDGQSKDYPLDQPAIIIGRAQGADLMLEHSSVSRRHARLSIESGQVMLEDLGSANGTFVGNQRLPADTPNLVVAGQAIRLGDVEIRYSAPPPVLVASIPSGDQTSVSNSAPVTVSPVVSPVKPAASAVEKPVNISLIGPFQPVAPGSVTTATLVIQNRGTVVDEMIVRVSGVPAEWVKISKDRLPLLPNAQEQITLTFAPPRRPDATAGDYHLMITVMSREHRVAENARGQLKVLPFQGFSLELQPVRGPKDFQLVVRNQGNSPASYRFSGSDEEGALSFGFSQDSVMLQPGQDGSIPFSVRSRNKPRIGANEMRMFNVLATPLEAGAEVKTSGQLVQRSRIPAWLIPLLALVMVCVCISAAAGYVTLCPTYAPGMPFCPAGAKPVIKTFLASPQAVDAGGTVILGWEVTGADQVELVAPVQNTLPLIGTQKFTLDQTTTYTLRAKNFAGTIEQSIVVNVKGAPPAIQTFKADPGAVIAGQASKVVLSWVVTNADSVSLVGVPVGQAYPLTGSVQIDAPTNTTTYTIVATNKNGVINQKLDVVVSSAGCLITNVMEGNKLPLLAGPAPTHPVIAKLVNGTVVDPIERDATASWLHVRAVNKEGWVSTNNVTCQAGNFLAFPTANPAVIPTAVPSNTPTATATATSTPTITPTPTISPTVFFHMPIFTTRVFILPFLLPTSTPTP